MPPEHLAAPPAFKADDIIAMNGSPDLHGWGPLSVGFGYRFSECRERLMDGRDQRRELVGGDLVAANIRGDNRRSEFSIK
jgi:hypothetical protein